MNYELKLLPLHPQNRKALLGYASYSEWNTPCVMAD